MRAADNGRRRWILAAIAWALCGVLGYSGAALLDYVISGAHDAQVVTDVKAAYYDAAGLADPAPEASSGPRTDAAGADGAAMKAYKALLQINPDAAGWICIPGTDIDYPVAQGENNRYYLGHNFKREQSAHACIFMDWRNGAGNLNTVIYGHDMKDGTFFGSLSDLRDKDYCAQHGMIELNLWGEDTSWRIFSVHTADDSAVPVQFSGIDEYAEYVKTVKQASEFDTGVEVTENDVILTLSTCDRGNQRLLVHAVRVEG